MRCSIVKYGFFLIIMVLISKHYLWASSPEANCFRITLHLRDSIDNKLPYKTKSTGINLKDSSLVENKHESSYLEARFQGFGPAERKDTIRRPIGITSDPVNNSSLSSIKNKADNNFITRNLYSLMIREGEPVKEQMAVKSTKYFQAYSGKIIGKIRILQLDVFGPTLQDTLKQASTWIGKTGNSVHMKTKEHKLMRQLLFNPGEKLDPQLMADNEKVIRDLPYIQDVAILVSRSKTDPSEVDVLLIIKERFEYGISGSFGTNSSEMEMVNENVFGIGHQFLASLEYNRNEKQVWGGTVNYEISDFGAKFIKTGLRYTNTFGKTGWNVYIDKQFLASKMDWAGGISLERTFKDYYQTPYSYTKLPIPASYLYLDTWYGQLIKSRAGSSLGNVILAGRYLHRNYYNSTSDNSGNSFFRDHDFILGTFGISKRDLFKNSRVYGYGITEDIPYGRYAEAAFGFDRDRVREHLRPYFHFLHSNASILSGGAYFKWQVGLGGYIGNSRIEQGVILLNTNFFSKFVYFNSHPYRYFVNMELMSGINRFKEEYLVMNKGYGIRDFYSLDIQGTNRLKINIESVRFWDLSYLGFRFANYFFADAAFLSNSMQRIFRENFYAGVGMGIRIHNESLVFKVLEFRLTWFPILPKNGDRYIFNVFGQPKARFDDFLGGKPQEILYE